MLGKLLKYEFKATARWFLPLFGALLIFALMMGLFAKIGVSGWLLGIPMGLATMLYMFVMVAIFALTFVVMIQRFYKNLLTDEGYLMFTLPVQPWQHLTCKTIVSTVWVVLSFIVAGLSAFFVALPSPMVLGEIMNELQYSYGQFVIQLGFSPAPYIFEGIIMVILSIVASILTVYVAIALGQLNNKHKLLASFGAFLVINAIVSIFGSICMVIFDKSGMANWFINLSPEALGHWFINGLSVACIIQIVIFFVITNVLLKKKLNLE